MSLQQLSKQLDNALRAIAVELARKMPEDKPYELKAIISKEYSTSPVKIAISLGSYYGDNTVKGNELSAVVSECLRRNGWKEAHEPMALIEGPKAIADDAIPF